MGIIREYLGKFTMYRLMIRFLLGLLGIAALLSWLGVLGLDPIAIIVGAVITVTVCLTANWLMAYAYKIKQNNESAQITGLILALIMGPSLTGLFWLPLVTASIAAMAAKYILKFHNRHLFNPAAFGAVCAALIFGQGASWWIGVPWLTALVLAGGLLIGFKIHRLKLIGVFIASYLALFVLFNATSLPVAITGQLLWSLLIGSPLAFFAFVMLIEPQTSPNQSKYHMLYAVFVAAIVVLAQTYVSSVSYTIEAALLIGNLATRLVQRDHKYNLALIRQEQWAPGIIGFWFDKPAHFTFQAGQFLQWTLPHTKPDNRGIRRWFTISASPSESELLITTKFSEKPSTFKQALLKVRPGDRLTATGLEGDFVLPAETTQPLVFLAGGIGITPFRSMIKFLIDTKESRPITLLYAAKTPDEFVFKDLFAAAEKTIGLKVRYITGPLDEHAIRASVTDLTKPLFYVSGPEPMVEALGEVLKKAGVPDTHLKQDFFPGYEA
jgi:ferredoxin-NADP reductase/Na+-transporting NADH:ubiquinone oxidoreductase subunit NqrB